MREWYEAITVTTPALYTVLHLQVYVVGQQESKKRNNRILLAAVMVNKVLILHDQIVYFDKGYVLLIMIA